MLYDNRAKSILNNIENKLNAVAERSYNKLPYTSLNGVHNDKSTSAVTWWTNGFWPGLMWLMYAYTNNEKYKLTAKHGELLLDKAFSQPEVLHHDVGFLWNITAGADYILTHDDNAKKRLIYAANFLAGRFNIKGGYIRAWNDKKDESCNIGWSIIDSMMNLPLLYRASQILNDDRYKYIAEAHADKTMLHHIRKDGSVRHIVEYSPYTGEFIAEHRGQGFDVGSSWSRGQAWALYGFTLSYIYTKDESYLNTAKLAANYFIAATCNDWKPRCDFRSPTDPIIYDTTAAAIAASGLLELANNLPVHEQQMYISAAKSLVYTLEKNFFVSDVETDELLTMCTESYHTTTGHHIPIIYGDYFFTEAIMKLSGNSFMAW